MRNLSPRAKRILLVLAQDEARKIGSSQLVPEHVILALLKMKEGIAYKVFDKLDLDPEKLKNNLEESFKDESHNPTLDTIPKSRRYHRKFKM